MDRLQQSRLELFELIDMVITIRLCNAIHRKSNSKLRKCAHMLSKRYKQTLVKNICVALSESEHVIEDIAQLQNKWLRG